MELRYAFILWIGIAVAVLLCVLAFVSKTKSMKKGTVKIANTELLLEDKYYKKQMIKYYIFRVMLVICVSLMIIVTAVLLSRPYYTKRINEQKYDRDIILCMDISSSVNDLNLKIVNELQDTVRSLSGERIGIVIFNTTPVVLSPLTDDYEYTIEQLETIKNAIKSQSSKASLINSRQWLYYNEYLYGGTLVGNTIRGSSLIGDGLLGGLFAFPDRDSDRTKVIIFSTDNDLNGEGYVTLKEAAEYCKRNNATVYGIGTNHMYTADMNEMKEAVELTGGKFFREGRASEFHEIVEEIESKSENLTEGKIIIKLVESPGRYFFVLSVLFILFIVLSILLKRANVLWSIGAVAMTVLLVLTYVFAVIPAKQFSKGPDIDIKKKSNLNVIFVVDNTISMLANDINGETRLDKAKRDVARIAEELDGAKFSVISFNNDASLIAPFSQDITHVKNAVDSLYPIESFYAKGSSLNIPQELMKAILEETKSDGSQNTAVFFISDGEITTEGAVLQSYKELAGYIDGGAVLGYGTKDGGTMRRIDEYREEGYEEIIDYDQYPSAPAISKIDEKNLNTMASDMGIEYVNMTSTTDVINDAKLLSTLKTLKSKIQIKEEKVEKENKEEYIDPPKYYGFLALIPFSILLIFNMVYIIRKK
ncbi:MAG: VWA domain-containing protein [Lachnospiraceae bacterium]|nr:VWA domain-containing protein [Lachnospiraceae bacterium]